MAVWRLLRGTRHDYGDERVIRVSADALYAQEDGSLLLVDVAVDGSVASLAAGVPGSAGVIVVREDAVVADVGGPGRKQIADPDGEPF